MTTEKRANVNLDDRKPRTLDCASGGDHHQHHLWLWFWIAVLTLSQLGSFIYFVLINQQENSLSFSPLCLINQSAADQQPQQQNLNGVRREELLLLLDELLPSYININSARKRREALPRHKKRESRRTHRSPQQQQQQITTASPEANVEFINPKFREEYLSRGSESVGVSSSGSISGGGSSPAENPWVWLNAYSRIPVNAIQEFCSSTKEYCPPGPEGPLGPPGPIGVRGPVGERGERGHPGEVGLRGPVGPPGPSGPKGSKGDYGKTGLPGLNGRDGVPGEPGLDGVPGRSGTPGNDGTPGIDGLPGTPGMNGIDGSPGLVGPIGESGPIGPQGLTGPRGKPGRSGIPGIPGVPGVNTWVVNSTDPRRRDIVLIPPSIPNVVIGGEVMANASRTTIIREGENLRLRCGAVGNPRPEVSWMRADGSLTPIGSWQTSDVLGHTFNITKVHRDHMGIYACVADNGIPPAAYRIFNVEVHFPPLISSKTTSVGVANGSHVILECDVEGFPEPLNYWERYDGRLIDRQHKTTLIDQGKYKVHMTLNLTITNPSADYGRYHCVSKNEMGITRGEIDVYDADPRFSGQPTGGTEVKTWGPSPPDMVDLEDMCPPVAECPLCPATSGNAKCRDGGLGIFDVTGRLDIRPVGNFTYPGFTNRTLDCVLSAIGKPVYHRFTDTPYGNWMRDSMPKTTADGEKYWATKYNQSYTLYEYTNKTTFKKDIPVRNYTLPFALKGYLHVIYNGSLYYHQQEESRVIRYELIAERNAMVSLPNATVTGNIFLYAQSQSYLDFSVDETGLWVIYGLQPTNNTAVAKLNPYSLELEYVWNISLNNQRAGEMFVACGVLYAVDSVTERNTKIRFALDLYKNKLLEVDLPFTNPFSKTTMIGYNARNKELYTWDKGNQLTYPVKSIDIGYHSQDTDPNDALENTGPEALVQPQDDWENSVIDTV